MQDQTLLTLEETATALNLSTRTVRQYVRRGMLITVRKKGTKAFFFPALDVDHLRAELQEDGPLRRADVLALKLRVRRLEERVAHLLSVVDATMDPLNLTEIDVRVRLNHLENARKQARWTYEELSDWADFYMRATELDLEKLCKCAPTAWRDIMELSGRQQIWCFSRPEKETNLLIQDLTRRMSEGRARIRRSVQLYLALQDIKGQGLAPLRARLD